MKFSKRIKRFFCKVKEKVLSSRAGVQREPVKEHSAPGVVDNVTVANGCGVTSNDGRPNRVSFGVESTSIVNRVMPEALAVEVIPDCSPPSISSAAAQDHHGRSSLTIGVSPQPSISPPLCGAIASPTHHLRSLHTPREGIVLHVPHAHQRTVVVMTDGHIPSPSDLESSIFRNGNSWSLSMDNPSPCQCSHLNGSGSTGRTIFAVIPEVYNEEPSYHHVTSPVHNLPSCSSTLHSTNGQACVTPHLPPPYAFLPALRHDTHYLDGHESLHTNPSPLIWVAPPQACAAHPGSGSSYVSPAASHKLQITCGCDTCSPRILRANEIGSSRVFPQRLPSRSYSTGSLHSHFALAGPRPTRSQSVLVGHASSSAGLSTIATSPLPPSPVPLTARSDTPPSRRDDSETTAEAVCEKLPPGSY